MALAGEPPVELSFGPGRPASLAAYAAATLITVFAVASQYFLPQAVASLRPVYGNLLGDLAVVYGLPLVAFLGLVGTRPLWNWSARMGAASVEGLRWFGIFSLLALLLSIALLVAYAVVDPSSVQQLSKTVPVVQGASGDPWFWIALSFAVGAIEETIFRGWVFGYWLDRAPTRWRGAALGTSLLFAGVHLYYWSTYGVIAPEPLLMLTLLGMAFAWAMALSGGNLVVIALLHGAFDAISFASILSLDTAAALHYGLVLAGLVVAAVVALRRRPVRPGSTVYREIELPPLT